MKAHSYKCFAYFSQLYDTPCRKYLDIRRNDLGENQKPELIIVMLNPGSCDNNHKWDTEIEVEPDATLRRIISFLDDKNFSFARVINLSDIQQKDSREFFKKRKEFDQLNIYNHSIFHDSRSSELSETVHKLVPVLLAFGTNKKSRDLIDMAINYFKGNGIRILNTDDKYYHPLMRPINGRKKWSDMVTGYQ